MTGSNAPSELWVRKMKALFKCFDSDQNGLIEIEDWKRQVEKMKSHGNLEGEKAKQLEKIITEWWSYLLKDKKSISFDDFIKARYEVTHTEEQQNFFMKQLKIMFQAIDANDDGSVSLDEFKVYHLAMGIEDNLTTEQAFKIIDLNQDGAISLDEFKEAVFDFTYNQQDSVYKEFYGPLPPN